MENDKSSKTEQTLDLWKGKLAHTSSGARRRPCPWRSSERPMCQLCQFLLSQYSLASWHDTHGFVPIASTTHHWCQHKAPCISAAPAIRSSGARSVAAPKRPPSQRAFAPSWIQIFEFRREKFFFLREGHGQKTGGKLKGGEVTNSLPVQVKSRAWTPHWLTVAGLTLQDLRKRLEEDHDGYVQSVDKKSVDVRGWPSTVTVSPDKPNRLLVSRVSVFRALRQP
jgi:hypothetical protein